MNAPLQVPARTECLRSVSVTKAVSAFLVAGLVVLTAVGFVLALALRQTATAEAIEQARRLTSFEATEVVGQVLTDEALVPGRAFDDLDRVVRRHVMTSGIVRVKVWDASGRIVYSDDHSIVGLSFPLAGDELALLRSGGSSAEVSDLTDAENQGEKKYGTLLQVYLGVRTPTGQRLMFETYQPYQVITDASQRLWLASLPVLLGGLALLYLVQAPLAYRMAHRLKRSQEEREAMLVASLAASDNERAMIAADLHDGIVQGLAGASYSLSAAAERTRGSDAATAQVMTATATDLRRWLRELRSLVVTITPPLLHVQGLSAALGDLAATLTVRGLAVTVEVTDAGQLDDKTEALIYRAAQEAVRNIVRHADAHSVTIRVARSGSASPGRRDETLVLHVHDDGCGFEPGCTTARSRGSVGLELLSAVASSHGGKLTIHASPGGGTELVLCVPLVHATEPPAGDPAQEPAKAMAFP